jgi:hypothetical protein
VLVVSHAHLIQLKLSNCSGFCKPVIQNLINYAEEKR